MSSQFRPDSSSLVDLKAEVYRKKEEAKRNKARTIYDESQYVPKIKNKSFKKKETVVKEVVNETDDDAASIRIQDSLRKKAALYDHLKGSRGKEDHEGLRDRFLVEFEEDEDDFVEYTDPLGRTRKVTREELRALKEEDTSWCDSRPPPSHHRSNPNQTDEGSEEALKRELLREKWSQEEEENLRKRDVHYGDLLFDEARTHGTGYYGFSREEVERHKEIDALKELHKETEEAQTASKKSQKAKSKLLAARLKKVRERKRLKMGLPIRSAGCEEEEDNEEDSTKKDSDSEDEKTGKKLEESIANNLRQMRDKRDAEDRKRKFVREWDLGKKEYHVMSQDDWVREKRSERNSEFAPVYSEDSKSRRSGGSRFGAASSSSYDYEKPRDSETSQTKSSMSMKERLELYSEYTCSSSKTKFQRRGAEIPPPVFNESICLPKPNLHESFNIGLKEKERLNQKDV